MQPRVSAMLRIRGRRLPGRRHGGYGNVHLALQHGRDYVDLTPGDAPTANFAAELVLAGDAIAGTDFRGPCVHGKRGARFVYLAWGDVGADGTFEMFRRAKIQLDRLPARVLAALQAGGFASATLDLTDRDGGPRCAAVAPATIEWDVG